MHTLPASSITSSVAFAELKRPICTLVMDVRLKARRCAHFKMVKGRVGWGEGSDWLANKLPGCTNGNKGSRRRKQPAGGGREQNEQEPHRNPSQKRKSLIQICILKEG